MDPKQVWAKKKSASFGEPKHCLLEVLKTLRALYGEDITYLVSDSTLVSPFPSFPM